MPSSILSSLLSKPSLSIVSSASGLDIASNLKVSRVGLRYRSRAMRHKREDGTSIVDARIILPCHCEIDVFVENLDDLAMVNSIMIDRTGVYKITSKGLIMTNMMLEEQVIKQTAIVISANPVRLQFKRLLIQDNQSVPQVEQAADSSLLDRGIQSVTSTLQSAQGAASQVFADAAELGASIFSKANM